MSFEDSHHAKERIRQAIDIVDVVGGSIELRRQGRIFVGRCPWHDDSRPSLQVNPQRQSWKCWVCDIGGDIFSFVMQREKIGFREAMEMLAEKAGVQLGPTGPQAKPGSPDDKKTLYAAMAWAANLFHECLLKSPDAEPARQYLEQRRISSDSIARFQLGYSPNSWQWLTDRAKKSPFSPAVLAAVDLVMQSETTGQFGDRFRGRVIFPIRDVQGRPIAIGSRILPELAKREEERLGRPPAKYINSRETRLFSKSETLYALDLVKESLGKEKSIIVVEGYTDALMAHQFGINNVVAVLGTALNERHLRLLRRFADSVTLLLDGDEAGQRRTNEILELFVAAQMDLRILTLPEEFDPDEFLLERGADAFRALHATAVDALEHRIRVATKGIDLVTDTHRANQALESILATIAKAPRQTGDQAQGQALREQQILARLARQFQIDESFLRNRVHEMRTKSSSAPSRPAPPPPEYAPNLDAEPAPPPEPKVVVFFSELGPREKELFEIMLLHPELAPLALEHFEPSDLPSATAKVILTLFKGLAVAGDLDFGTIMSATDDPKLKNVLVQLDERAQAKASQVQETGEQRLERLIKDFHYRKAEPERRQKLAVLQDRRVDEHEQLTILEELLKKQRERQGISIPTDG